MKRNQWFFLIILLVLPVSAVLQISLKFGGWFLPCWFGFVSLIGFSAVGLDKRKARRDKRRISEKSLHLIELFGGWPGSFVGQQFFRHKTAKRKYQILFWTSVFLYQVIGVIVLNFSFR